MNRITFIASLIFALAFFAACGNDKDKSMINSPDGKNTLVFMLDNGVPKYSIIRNNKAIINMSRMGFKLKNLPSLDSDFVVIKQNTSNFDETWEQPWGEKREIRNNYNELVVQLEQNDTLKRKLNIVFRLFNDGLGFRYEIPEQKNLKEFAILDEETEFNLDGNHSAWWIPAYRDNKYEYLYKNTPVNEMDTVHTPLTMKTEDGLYLSIHEAALVNYASMVICSNKKNGLKCDLVPWADGVKVYTKAPMKTPWRTIQIGEKAGDLITSYLVLNLNEPNKLGDVSWIKPGKYVGIWWGMHIGLYTWSSGPKHGAITENAIKYIDFAAKYGFSGVLIEGWNQSWDGDWIQNGSIFNFTKPYPDFDIKKVTEYAASKGVKIIGHHETGADVENYGKQLDTAYKYYKSLGIDIVKSGYVGTRLNKKEWHLGQFGVNFYHHALVEAAKYKIMLDVHEPIKGTGEQRTYPNMMSREGARGMEYDAWSPDGGNPPNHTTILPFTRLLAGPMDFTPGVFDIMIKEKPNNRSNTTLAKQLAFYVVIYSPFQMACDLPENYEANLEPFQFIRDVPTDWEDTKVLNGEIGEYVTIVRKAKNSEQWFLGSITNEKSRDLLIDLSFLDNGKKYKAQVYADGVTTHWKNNPLTISISEIDVNSNSILKIRLAPGGGQAICFYPVN
jgi:alpha-glucosidase